ncbi:MCE family protein [Nocardia sp. NBC_00565]|uniref:MlaD family protein n=1 Tax=Nocardia sp. NBC_00565 TaxID=2975993 RepID=UPI002E81EE30|nr:MlaD family protein [Nocardia sp. NBC_00565]WUC05855.1 MCE family protein [Nocardia sp. NBC_00565]
MSYRKPLIWLIVFLTVSIVLTWTVYITLQRSVPGSTHRYSAIFTDVSGLRSGDDVRMAGVRVGRVDAIDLDGAAAKVTFQVQRDQVLYGNTMAAVTYQNLIGQRYLGLSLGDFGDPRVLPPGARIPVEHTEPSFDLSKLLNGFEPLFSVLRPEQVDNITSAVIRAFQGDDGAVTTLITETSTLAQSFAGPDRVLGQVIDNLSGVLTDLAKQTGNLQTVIEQTKRIFNGLAQQRDALFAQIDSISTVVRRTADVVPGAQPSLAEFITRQPGFAAHLLDNKDKFAYLGFNLPLLLKAMSRIVDSGAYLNAYICDITVSLVPGAEQVIPRILGLATPSGHAEHSAICR